MPITYQIDSEGLDFYAAFEGTITPREVIDYFAQMAAELGAFTNGRALLEVRNVALRQFTFASISRIAAATKRHEDSFGTSKIAVVAPQSVAFGIARMYIAIRDPKYDFSVFRERDAAMAWLRQGCA